MRSLVRKNKGQTGTLLARVLAFVLLGIIVQAVTFGSAHSHTSGASVREGGQFASSAGLAEYAVPDPFHYQNQRQECLTCLFHQQLFNSVVHSPFFVAEQALPDASSKQDKLLHYSNSFTSTPIARLSGRAPPRS
jgi:hypothetical protein